MCVPRVVQYGILSSLRLQSVFSGVRLTALNPALDRQDWEAVHPEGRVRFPDKGQREPFSSWQVFVQVGFLSCACPDRACGLLVNDNGLVLV